MILTMFWRSLAQYYHKRSQSAKCALIGGIFFLISDAVLGTELFSYPQLLTSSLFRIIVLNSYYCAQLAFTLSVIVSDKAAIGQRVLNRAKKWSVITFLSYYNYFCCSLYLLERRSITNMRRVISIEFHKLYMKSYITKCIECRLRSFVCCCCKEKIIYTIRSKRFILYGCADILIKFSAKKFYLCCCEWD